MKDAIIAGFIGIAVLVVGSLCIGVMTIMGGACSWVNEGAQVLQEEVGPRALLQKYSWFKDAAAVLDKKLADMKVYDQRIKRLLEQYKDEPRSKWARDDREQWSIWQSEAAGIRASYNSLAAEYNAAMAKLNWAFCEVGKLPPGATQPLPREYKPYAEE